jgi:hypothetical protein
MCVVHAHFTSVRNKQSFLKVKIKIKIFEHVHVACALYYLKKSESAWGHFGT